MATPD